MTTQPQRDQLLQRIRELKRDKAFYQEKITGEEERIDGYRAELAQPDTTNVKRRELEREVRGNEDVIQSWKQLISRADTELAQKRTALAQLDAVQDSTSSPSISLQASDQGQGSTSSPTVNQDAVDKEGAKKLLYEAMEKGYVTSQHVVIVLVGIAGTGKSSFKRVVLELPRPPEDKRVSTPLAATIRNISISRAIINDPDSIKWEVITSEKLLEMVAEAVKEIALPVPTGPTKMSAAPSEDEANQHAPFEFEDDPLLLLISQAKGSRRLLDVHWVYIIDTGGQPQFLQLLPAFIKNISSCVCLVRLDQSLDLKPLVKYFDQSGKQCGKSYPSEKTNLQVIESCLRTIHSKYCLDSDTPPSCFVVGTHLDVYENEKCAETIKEKNERLLRQFSDTLLKHSLVLFKPNDEDTEELIYPLNCKNPEERDQAVAAKFRKSVMRHSAEPECKIPLAWFVLEQRIRQYAVKHGVAYVERATCFKIASHGLHMTSEVFEAALSYLLKLNIFRCYTSLPNLIFCDTQVVLHKLTELVQYSHQLKRDTSIGISGVDRSFKNEGIVSIKYLERFSSFYTNLFTPECFLNILCELLAVADMQGGKYFLPCLLNELSDKEICKYCSSVQLPPLLILLKDNCLPNGLFTSVIAFLINNCRWKLAYNQRNLQKPICLFQNCVTFTLPEDVPGFVTLIATFSFLEVHVDCLVEKEIDSVCVEVFKDIKRGLEESWRVLYSGDISFSCTFFCDSCKFAKVQKHHSIISKGKYEKCSISHSCFSELRSSKLRWLKNINAASSTTNVTITRQSDVHSSEDLKLSPQPFNDKSPLDPTLPPKLPPQPTPLAAQISSPEPHVSQPRLTTDHIAAVCCCLYPLRAKWKTIGIFLHINSNTLAAIKKDNDDSDDRLTELIAVWLRRHTPPPTWQALADVVGYIDPNKAEEIRTSYNCQ